MSANLDLVRSIYADWERGNFASAPWAHPKIQFVIVGGPDPGFWTGVAAMSDSWHRFLGAWESFRVAADDYRELDQERILVLIHRSGHGRRSGLGVEQMGSEAADLFHIDESKVTKLVHYWDRHRALADLGWNAEVFRGRDAVMRFYTDRFEAFEEIIIEADRLIDAGDSVVVPNVAHQRSRNGVVVSARSTLVFTVHGGAITRICLYQETEQALKAVALEE